MDQNSDMWEKVK